MAAGRFFILKNDGQQWLTMGIENEIAIIAAFEFLRWFCIRKADQCTDSTVFNSIHRSDDQMAIVSLEVND